MKYKVSIKQELTGMIWFLTSAILIAKLCSYFSVSFKWSFIICSVISIGGLKLIDAWFESRK